MFLVFSNHFDVLMLKIIFKKSKNIIDMYFSTKSYLKSNRNHTAKQQKTRLKGVDFSCHSAHKIIFWWTINNSPHNLRRVNMVAAMKKTIDIATQKC